MRRYVKYSTPEPEMLQQARAVLEDIITGRCPACGDTLPNEPERYELAPGRYYCARCGWEVGQDA